MEKILDYDVYRLRYDIYFIRIYLTGISRIFHSPTQASLWRRKTGQILGERHET